MSLVNMKMSQAERDEQSVIGSDSKEVYPYGLQLQLDDEDLGKLQMLDDLPDVGEVVTFTAKAVVTSVSQNASGESDDPSDKEQRVSLQITDMDVHADTMEQQAEKNLYGG